MTRKNRSPEENARRAKIRELLLSSNISSMDDIQDLFMLKDGPDPEEGLAKWENHYQASIPVDVQTGKLIIFTYGDAETFSVPEMMTWDKVQ